ncbi:MAG TPA: hypothetical protein VFH80_12870 [Solirubrobacteraceae bacterium]|nr:hypothetical protein [Solirubrobacteraceae bacterium]
MSRLTRRYHLPSALRPSSFRIEAPAAHALVQDGAVLLDGAALGLGGILILARRPEARWLGCTTLPVACLAGIDPDAVVEQTERRKQLVSSAPVRRVDPPVNRSRARTSAPRSGA